MPGIPGHRSRCCNNIRGHSTNQGNQGTVKPATQCIITAAASDCSFWRPNCDWRGDQSLSLTVKASFFIRVGRPVSLVFPPSLFRSSLLPFLPSPPPFSRPIDGQAIEQAIEQPIHRAIDRATKRSSDRPSDPATERSSERWMNRAMNRAVFGLRF